MTTTLKASQARILTEREAKVRFCHIGFENFTTERAIEVAHALTDIHVRDTYLFDAQRTQFNTDRCGSAMSRLWQSCPDDVRLTKPFAPMSTVIGILAWISGQQDLAEQAINVALTLDPEYALAQLVGMTLAVGLPPSSWAEAMGALTRDECLKGAGR